MLVLVSIQLGIFGIDEAYHPVFAAIFKMKHSVGAVGGISGHSLYFMGIEYSEEEIGKLVYLDPHFI